MIIETQLDKVSWYKRFRLKLFLFIKKDKPISAFNTFRFIGNFLITYSVFWLGIYTPLRLKTENGVPFTNTQWWVVCSVPFLLVFFTYFRENYITKGREKRLKKDAVIFNSISSVIKKIASTNFNLIDKDKTIQQILLFIQRIVRVILAEEKVPTGTICTNLMMYYSNPDRLILEYMVAYTEGHGEDRFTLPIDIDNPTIGAPTSFVTGKIIYINDTKSEAYIKYFNSDNDNDEVRCFISIPIKDDNKKVIAVLNIDSDVAQQFISSDYIKKRIFPMIYIFILFIRLVFKHFNRS